MKIIYNKILPAKGYAAINLFGFVFARKELNPISDRTKNHEAIHTAQGKEMLWIFFYLWYAIEWIIRLVQYRDRKKPTVIYHSSVRHMLMIDQSII